MSAVERPWVNCYEPDTDGVEQLVYRQMNDAEFAQWQADEAAAAEAEAAYAAAPATAEDHAAVSASIITEQLDSVGITREVLPTILQTLLGQAQPAIEFFEQHALDPAMDSPQWTAFQALDQTTKDRLLYDLLRTVAALLRYQTGNLPTAT